MKARCDVTSWILCLLVTIVNLKVAGYCVTLRCSECVQIVNSATCGRVQLRPESPMFYTLQSIYNELVNKKKHVFANITPMPFQ